MKELYSKEEVKDIMEVLYDLTLKKEYFSKEAIFDMALDIAPSQINRVEVIDYYNNKGRAFVFWKNDAEIEISMQDDNRTMKVFINKKK